MSAHKSFYKKPALTILNFEIKKSPFVATSLPYFVFALWDLPYLQVTGAFGWWQESVVAPSLLFAELSSRHS